jgi:hypothetical protein
MAQVLAYSSFSNVFDLRLWGDKQLQIYPFFAREEVIIIILQIFINIPVHILYSLLLIEKPVMVKILLRTIGGGRASSPSPPGFFFGGGGGVEIKKKKKKELYQLLIMGGTITVFGTICAPQLCGNL